MSNGNSMHQRKYKKNSLDAGGKGGQRFLLSLPARQLGKAVAHLQSVTPSRPWMMYLTHTSLQQRHWVSAALGTSSTHLNICLLHDSMSWVTQNVTVFHVYLCPKIFSLFRTLQPGNGTGGTEWEKGADTAGTFKVFSGRHHGFLCHIIFVFHLYFLIFVPYWWKGIGWTHKWRQLIWECSPLNCLKSRHTIMGMKTQVWVFNISPVLPLHSCCAQHSTNLAQLWGLPVYWLVGLTFVDILSCWQTEHSTYCSSGTHLWSGNI